MSEPAVGYDPFSGSGRTGRAALLRGRRYIGSELSASSNAQAVDRLSMNVPLPLLLAAASH